MAENLERWLDMTELAAYLGMRRETILSWIHKKDMPAQRFGNKWKFKASEVDEWIRNGGAAMKDKEAAEL